MTTPDTVAPSATAGTILIMAGGTGGHVFPALAVAEYLRERGVAVHWMGTDKGIEAKVIPENAIALHCIEVSGIRGKSWKKLLTGPFAVAKAIAQAKRIIRELKPDVILGMGGYASGPGGVAARLCGIPLIVHEQNAIAGSTNKVLAKLARHVLCGFPNALPKGVFVGNPVRTAFYQQRPPAERRSESAGDDFKILVLGGSLGAKALNEKVPEALALLSPEFSVSVTHQSGARTKVAAQHAYAALAEQRPNYSVELPEFIADVASAMAAADLVICRAGALTVAELSAIGAAAILVPFPFAIDDHQTANARWLSDKGAAILCPEASLQAQSLADQITGLYQDRGQLEKMALAAYARTEKTPTVQVADYCLEYLNV
ncbi:MAG TPA: undecaprenyldiphospho-muramoylpentapeptide beta-N-acetylglucosaminyltransferase [Marinagarivorans sp.]